MQTRSPLRRSNPGSRRQRPDGKFIDYVPKRQGIDNYGTGMLGMAILDQGVRLGDQRRIDVGLKAMRFASRRALRLANHRSRRARRVVFDNFAVASAYNIARHSLASDPRFLAIAPTWRRALRAMGRRVLGIHGYYNFKLVHAAATMELLHSGLRSNRPGATLSNRRQARRWVRRLINYDVPKVARHYDRGKGPGRTTVISDPPWNPPAYQAFSLMMLTRVIERMDGAASRSARAALNASLRGMATTMGPDGDVSYVGRSQEQSWTLSGVAYAATVAERDPDPAIRQMASAAGARALVRLRDDYWRDGLGFVMTPSFVHSGTRQAARGIDNYAAGTSYAALTIAALELAAHEPPIGNGVNLPVPADVQGVNFVGRGHSTLATVRAGNRWFAVSRAPARLAGKNSLYARDIRYDAGLVAFKAPDPSGRWIDVMAQRPRSTRPDSAGPTIRRFGRIWRPVGQRVRASARGSITIDGELRDFMGRPAHRRLRMIVAPESCGVRVSFGVAGGVAHDFNNLLQAMLSLTQMLVGHLADPERLKADAAELEQQVRRGAALTRQLLLFSRRETARPERLDLNEVVRDGLALLRRLLKANVAVEAHLAEEWLPVEADRGQLGQVLLNLAVNAGDAMSDGGRLAIETGADGPRCG